VRAFTHALLEDLKAFEILLERDAFEHEPRRIGVEQEMFLVDARLRPAPIAPELLVKLGDRRLTSELARFNLEANLDPIEVGPGLLSTLERQLREVLDKVEQGASDFGARAALMGTLPTLRRNDLELENMTPEPRYYALNQSLRRFRGSDFHVVIAGQDELTARADSVMLESANASLQLHLQVSPAEFPHLHNLAQLVTAPLLGAAVNSPVLLGRRLWHETRVALFERSVDGRSVVQTSRGQQARVSFGESWTRGSALETFRETTARHRVLLLRDAEADPVELARGGLIPKLWALTLHNGTVWPWNRLCYGAGPARAHLRIENRVLPAGPTLADEVGNAAFFYGMMAGLEGEAASVPDRLAFQRARENFIEAARHGLDAELTWLDGRRVGCRELILDELLPLARSGLRRWKLEPSEVDRWLGVVEARVARRMTGARWILDALAPTTSEAALTSVTAALLDHQHEDQPVAFWPPYREHSSSAPPAGGRSVADIMTTDLFTVHPEDVVDLATSMMQWEHVRHVPVEDDSGRLVGLISHRELLDLAARGSPPASVADLMDMNPDTIHPDAPLHEAAARLLESRSACLLVVAGEKLVGIVTQLDMLRETAVLLNHG
jgi:CBS domain-containing protein